ncbi:MAG: polyprenol monophosphomannose synthase [Planctomycetaceae bacterium]|nr:polyprenol monophosphomannose synthase [Planctomycetaceae bacterium]MBQ2822355.1 polyprenol monophosphomannose synthase [Thermoguttaceae bacterium]
MNLTRFLITIATFNEIENLPRLVTEIFAETDRFAAKYGFSFDILVIDDNSPDGTGRWCDEHSAEFPRLKCLHRSGKNGLGTAVIEAMKYAIEHQYDRMINLDADFSHHPRYLEAIASGTDDVIVGSRYVRGGGIIGWPFMRHVMSRSINTFGRFLLGLSVRDISGSYRNYRVSCLAKLDFDRFQSRGYSFFEEVLWRLKLLGAKMSEVPIVFEDRVRGKSKISLKESITAVKTLITLKK